MITDRQEMFNAAWNGLKAQNWFKSTKPNEFGDNTCVYDAGNGIRCAIGHCLNDNELGVVEEGTNAEDVLKSLGIGDEDLCEFADDLQWAHDTSKDEEDMQKRLREFAREHKLKVPE